MAFLSLRIGKLLCKCCSTPVSGKPPSPAFLPNLTLKVNSHLVHSAHEFDHEHAEAECEEGELPSEAAWEVVEEVEGDLDIGNFVAPGAGRVGVFELEWHGRRCAVFSNHAFAAFGHGGAFGVVGEAAAGETFGHGGN